MPANSAKGIRRKEYVTRVASGERKSVGGGPGVGSGGWEVIWEADYIPVVTSAGGTIPCVISSTVDRSQGSVMLTLVCCRGIHGGQTTLQMPMMPTRMPPQVMRHTRLRTVKLSD